jgi:hypothetical protein
MNFTKGKTCEPEITCSVIIVISLLYYCYIIRCLAKSLGEAGEIEPETEGMLIENGVDFEEFPQEVNVYIHTRFILFI